MAFDIKKFLIEDLGMDPAEAETTAGKIKPEHVSRVEKSYGLASSNTAAAAEIEKTRADLASLNERLQNEMVEWASLSGKEKAEATTLRKSLEAAQVRATQLESRLTALAADHGVDPKTLLDGTVPLPKKEDVVAPVIDPSKYVAADQFGAFGAYSMDLAASIPYLMEQHKALTGETLDPRTLIAEIKTRAAKGKDQNVDPVAVWESMHDIPAKRAAKQQQDYDAAISAAEARGEERGRSTTQLPGQMPTAQRGPIFGHKDGSGTFVPRTSSIKRPQPGTGTLSAVNAFRTGKYKTPVTAGR